MFDQMNRGKILNAQTKFSRGLELSQLLYDTRCIPGIYYDYLMRCLERVPLHPYASSLIAQITRPSWIRTALPLFSATQFASLQRGDENYPSIVPNLRWT